MDGFADNFDQPEVDPAAEFLAREQNELAGLDDDIPAAAAASAPAPVVTNGMLAWIQSSSVSARLGSFRCHPA